MLDAEKESGRVQLSSANETDSQLFQVDYQGKGYYRIISKSSGNVLGVKDNSEKAGAEVQQFKWDEAMGSCGNSLTAMMEHITLSRNWELYWKWRMVKL